MDILDAIMDIECGDISEERFIECYQYLIDNGIVWNLQGSYGRTAMALIEAGLCTNEAWSLS
jgi:hypothetical protein